MTRGAAGTRDRIRASSRRRAGRSTSAGPTSYSFRRTSTTTRRYGSASLAAKRRVPVLLGGPFFNVPGVAGAWLDIEGLTAIVGAEVDFTLPDIVAALIEGGDLLQFAGVYLPDGRSSGQAPPLRSLDALPVPDFTDFPWHHYRNRVIPAMTGRGCGWGQCTFCADVVTANGRTFRSRPLGALLAELEEQSRRHDAKDVIFLDIKLNSDVAMWRGIIEDYQRRLPGGRWVGTVHVEARGDNGLSLDDLRAARAAGMMRTSFGLETGSQRVNNTMAKGTSLDRTSVFMRDAHTAGISVRTTAMVGYPGETAADVAATAAFLRQHARYLDHVTLSRFKAIPGTRFEQLRERSPERYESLVGFAWDRRGARAHYRYAPASARPYRRAISDLLDTVYDINRAPIRETAAVFDGLM